jgi:glutathione transport system ATP-binding protein
MGVVAEVADRVVVMRGGQKIEDGAAEQIFHAPREPYTRALLAAVPRLHSMRGKDTPEKFHLVLGGAPEVPVTAHAPRAGTGAPLLKVRGLTTHFDVKTGFFGRVTRLVHAVEKVSFTFAAALALVGESGCGKSTPAARCCGRLMSQSIEFEGRDIARSRRRGAPIRRDIK